MTATPRTPGSDKRAQKVAWSRLSDRFLPFDIDSLENRDDDLIIELAARLGDAVCRYFRFSPQGFDQIPDGAGLFVANHNGGALTPDTFLFSSELIRTRGIQDVPYALAHQAVMQMPLFHHLFAKIGAVRASHRNAGKAFAAGRKVLVYPGGGRRRVSTLQETQRDRVWRTNRIHPLGLA